MNPGNWAGIRAVTLDVGGTLIEPWPSVGHVYAEVAAAHGVEGADPETLTRQFIQAWRTRTEFRYTRPEWFGIVRDAFGERAPSLPEAFFPAVYHRFTEADVWRIYEDVEPALRVLAARGVRVAAISNWDERLHPLLRTLALHDHFECVVISHDVGHTKPSRAIFEEALRRLRLAPETVLHVGDSAREDVEGARQAGMHSLRIERGPGGGDLRQLLAPLLAED